MKQILQSIKTGETSIVEVPCPQLKPGHVLIKTTTSLISSGTEKMLVDFGKASLIEKIRQQPDKVKMVFDKIKSDGLLTTIDAVRSQLDKLMPMGYCNVGTVSALSPGINELSIGDRVVSNGAHAEIVVVPKNLCCKIPNNITDEEAAFTILGAIALQGLRLAHPTLGENFVVIGLGLIGLLTVQLLRAQGCRVLAIDLDAEKTSLANFFGAEIVNIGLGDDALSIAQTFSRHRGIDGVLITASTKSSDPVHLAAQMCRQRGRIILVGVTGLTLSRAEFYKKELTFQVSCSYGPGRYDMNYEEQGQDYPIGFVRWTEQRNFEAFIDLLNAKTIVTAPLISHRFNLTEAKKAYDLLTHKTKTLGILINYADSTDQDIPSTSQTIQLNKNPANPESSICLGMIGAGNYASRVLMPAFKLKQVTLKKIACVSGISGTLMGKKFKFAEATTNVQDIFLDETINTIVIASRHETHADFICQASKANKHIFVEKPLCLTLAELEKIKNDRHHSKQVLMVGFNRRFAPHIQTIKKLLKPISEPKSFIMTINAGDIPKEHWTQNSEIGGGRIIGEVCHFIDLLRFLSGEKICLFNITQLKGTALSTDKVSIALTFNDGSFGVIHYLANGHRSFPKERLEIFAAGKILQLDNYRKLRAYGFPHFKRMNLWHQDKGQTTCIKQFIHAIQYAHPSPIPFEEISEVSRVTLEIAQEAGSHVSFTNSYQNNQL